MGATARRSGPEAGFSMVEMLMAAFILAIGVLGLATLQAMSLKAARGGHSLTNAVAVSNQIMDQIEYEGRLSWLNITDTTNGPPVPITTLVYVGKGNQYLGFKEYLDTTTNLVKVVAVTAAPQASKPALGGTVRYVATITEGTAVSAGTGLQSSYGVKVEFQDDVNKTGGAIVRSLYITRSILHG